MALATLAVRLGGLLLVRWLEPTPAVQAALDALPVAVLTAVIVPGIVKGGPPDLIAAAVTFVAAFRLPLIAVVVVGGVSVVLLRAWLG
jgi:uncharacterized membrane protein